MVRRQKRRQTDEGVFEVGMIYTVRNAASNAIIL